MGNPFKGQAIPKPIIERAIANNASMRMAASSIHVSYITFKKYAKIYDLWAPKNPKDIDYVATRSRMKHWTGKDELGMTKHNTLKRELIIEGHKEQKCDHCGHNQYRNSDMLSPLILYFVNRDENDTSLENIKFYCYNCYFILYDVKMKPTQAKLSAQKKSDPHNNRFTQQLENKLEKEVEKEKDASKLGENLVAIFK